MNSFLALNPTVTVNEYCKSFTCNAISFTRNKSDFLLLVCVAILWGIAIFHSKRFVFEKKWQNLYLVCCLIIAFNFTLHAIFGREMFLYTQHWITALFLLLVPILQNKRFISIGLLLLLVIVNVKFLLNVESLVAMQYPKGLK